MSNIRLLWAATTVLVAVLAVQVAEAQPRGTADIVWQHFSGQVHYWSMQGGQRTGGVNVFTPVGNDWVLRGVGDVDGNGTADIVWQHFSGQVHYWSMQGGQRTGGVNVFTPVGNDWVLRGVGDVDGNGTADIVWQHFSGQVHYWSMQGGQRTGGVNVFTPVGNDWVLRGVGDVDGNGTADIVWQHFSGQVHYWSMQGGQRTGGVNVFTPVGNDWVLRGVGDVDGNGTADIVWQHFSGQVHYWSMQGGQRTGGVNVFTPVGNDWVLRGVGDVTGLALLVNIIPFSLSNETNQDSEPFLAAHPTNPLRIAASAFTPNPFSPTGNAPIFVSADGGNTWALNTIVPSTGMTSDITHASTGGIATLYAGILRRPGSLLLNELVTTDLTSPTLMTVQASRSNVDQPFVQAIPIGGNDRIYVGNNDFGAPSGRTATVDVSLNGGATFTAARIETRNTSGQNGPSIRPTAARDGTVYAAFFGWRSFTGGIATSDIVVVRDDAGAAGPNPFRALTDTDGLAGRRVVQNVTIPWSNAPTLGQERIGSTLSIAVDPNNSTTVYTAWGDRVGTGDIYTIHVRRSTDRGVTWSNDLRTITNATTPALAVADNGTVALLYQQVTGTGASSRWVTHLEQTRNAFTTAQDTVLATVPATTPAFQFLPYIGDYNFLLAVGNEFRGIFSANNTPDLANFPQGVRYQRRANFTTRTLDDGAGGAVAISIDPFYFRILVMQ